MKCIFASLYSKRGSKWQVMETVHKIFGQLSNQNATMRGGSYLKATTMANIPHCNFVSIFAHGLHEGEKKYIIKSIGKVVLAQSVLFEVTGQIGTFLMRLAEQPFNTQG